MMVPLRSRYPHMGRVTLRYPAPVIHTAYDPDELDAALRAVLNEQHPQTHQSTTPQVGETATETAAADAPAPPATDDRVDSAETTARKGGGAP